MYYELIGVGVTIITTAAASNILIVGDSWAELAEDFLQEDCEGSSVTNRGSSGSTAAEWGGEDDECCSAADAFEEDSFSHAWISVGGNDMLRPGCDADGAQAAVPGALESAMRAFADAGPGVPKLVLGYSAVAADEEGCGPADVARLNAQIEAAAAAYDDVTFVDVLETLGGSATEYSSERFYDDAIHPNRDGYEVLFKLPEVQAFFGCGGAESTPAPEEPAPAPAPDQPEEPDEDPYGDEPDEEPVLPDESDGASALRVSLAAVLVLALALVV